MKISSSNLFEEIKIIQAFNSQDSRGGFIKYFNADEFRQAGLAFEICEIYYSISSKNVIRGMHFQLPPYEHEKLVHVVNGRVLDVVVDIRKNSKTYGKHFMFELSGENKEAIFIPKGFAHGFKVLEDNTLMQYCVSSVYNKEADCGIRYDSCGINWELSNPIISDRDNSFVSLAEFDSPFIKE